MRKKIPFPLIVVGLFLAWFLIQAVISIYPTFLWFDHLGFSSVFWVSLWAKVLVGLFFGLFFFIIAIVNVLIARFLGKESRKVKRRISSPKEFQRFIRRLMGESPPEEETEYEIEMAPEDETAQRRINLLWGLGILIFAAFVGLGAVSQWQVVLKALNAVSFGIKDPVFSFDISFYLFSFPLQKFVQGFFFSAVLLSIFASIFIYFLDNNLSFSSMKLNFGRGVKAHLFILLAVLAILFAWGLWLSELEILYSSRGVVFGAGYTDVKAQLLGYNLQILAVIFLAMIFVFSIFWTEYRLILGGVFAYLLLALVMGGIYPAIVQNFQVKPSEITMEAPYIKNAIHFTRLAYGLENVEEKKFSVSENLTRRDLYRNRKTVDNIRLWDNRPLLKSYRQLQGIRLYYDFVDVDVDRYHLNGEYRQVMLSPREMDVTKLPEKARTWINQHLKFTHGYGICMSPVSRQTPEGLPDLIVKDIPPVSSVGIKIDRPEIYYGEKTSNYVIVNTTEKEFDYPKGDKNVYTTYEGYGGVQINSLLRRLAFTIKFSDLKILLTDYITDQSRILFDRNIRVRVSKIAPFLRYDRDPYIVILGGRLYWIQDAYTTSNLFPYSEPTGSGFSRFNYIRNSVKIIVDAYNGDVSFYLIDEKDPIARTYQKIYPELFKPFDEMPQGLKEHLRYPYDLFMVQANKYAIFHMRDPEVFYNQEDLWNIPNEIYMSSEQRMDAYSVIMRLPEERKAEFLLMLPFTPNNKDNMISWMAGRSDIENYGKLIVYKFPKEKLVYGPMQIEARIDQQTEISQQFTLWGQVGSRVIRGNLLAIPIEDTIVYVEPIFLEASSGELPELKRVIAAYGKNVAMAETLEGALDAVLSGRRTRRLDVSVPVGLSLKELARRALSTLQRAETSLRQGSYSDFGDKLRELKKILQDLNK